MNLHKDNTTIIAIAGEYNDVVAKILEGVDYSLHKEKSSMKKVVGYTTSPLAVGETQGKNMMHLSAMPEMKMSDVFLYKNDKNGYERWFQTVQFKTWDKNIILVDREDFGTLKNGEGKEIEGWKYKVVTVEIWTESDKGWTMNDGRSTMDGIKCGMHDNPMVDFVLHINDETTLDVVHKKVKMLHGFIKRNRKGLWL